MTANTIHLPALNALSERIKENGQAPAQTRPGFWPELPYKVEELGIPRSSVIDLILRRLYAVGTGTLETLSATLKLSWQVVETVFHQLRQQQLVEVKGMVGNDYTFVLTDNGRAMAAERVADVQLCRSGAGLDSGLSPVHAGADGQVSVNRATLAQGVRRSGGDRRHPGSTGAVAHLAKIGVPVRSDRKRQDQPGGENAARLYGPHPDSARGGSGRAGHHAVRSRGASQAGYAGRDPGPALDAVPAGRSSRWAANWCRACSNCAWTNPPASTRLPSR